MIEVTVRRLVRGEARAAGATFALMAGVFGEASEPLPDDYLENLLCRDGLWVPAAFRGLEIVGGLTAHTLPITRSPSAELFIYDLAVHEDHQRTGIGSLLVRELRERAALAGIKDVFVAADNDDAHALDFYQAQGADGRP